MAFARCFHSCRALLAKRPCLECVILSSHAIFEVFEEFLPAVWVHTFLVADRLQEGSVDFEHRVSIWKLISRFGKVKYERLVYALVFRILIVLHVNVVIRIA